MNLAEYSSCDGVALADLVRKREVSPKELAHLLVEAIEKVNPRINAVIEVYFDRIEGLDDHAISASLIIAGFFLMNSRVSGSGNSPINARIEMCAFRSPTLVQKLKTSLRETFPNPVLPQVTSTINY